jgi:hypothetical protein
MYEATPSIRAMALEVLASTEVKIDVKLAITHAITNPPQICKKMQVNRSVLLYGKMSP